MNLLADEGIDKPIVDVLRINGFSALVGLPQPSRCLVL